MAKTKMDFLSATQDLCEEIYDLYLNRTVLDLNNLLSTNYGTDNFEAIKLRRDAEKESICSNNMVQQTLPYAMIMTGILGKKITGYYDIEEILEKNIHILPYLRIMNTNDVTIFESGSEIYHYAQIRDYLMSCFLIYAEMYARNQNDVDLLKTFFRLKYLTIYLNTSIEDNYLKNKSCINLGDQKDKLLRAFGDNYQQKVGEVAMEQASNEIDKLLFIHKGSDIRDLRIVNILRGCYLRVCLHNMSQDDIKRLYNSYQIYKDSADYPKIDGSVLTIIDDSFAEVMDINHQL